MSCYDAQIVDERMGDILCSMEAANKVFSKRADDTESGEFEIYNICVQ